MGRIFWSEGMTQILRDMAHEGYSSGMIALRLERTRSSVIGKAWRNRIALGKRGIHHVVCRVWPPVLVEQLVEMWQAGCSSGEIAQATGRDKRQIYIKLKHLRSKGIECQKRR